MCVQPVYFAEITPKQYSGQISTTTGLLVECGYLMGSIVALPQFLGTAQLWPWIFWIEVVPNIMALVLLAFIPESPKYILSRSTTHEKASKALEFYGHAEPQVN